jgi:hypothetical protein
MRKLLLASLLILATLAGTALAQTGATQTTEVPNMGRAPKQPDGIGRLDLRVVDEQGNPVEGVRADLKSTRSNGFRCESWNWTNAQGVAVLPPLHMGRLQLTLKAKGYETLKLSVDAGALDEPLRVTMARK